MHEQMIPSTACPISLECLIGYGMHRELEDGGWCVNADYCNNLAHPWWLPYSYDYWENRGVLHVNIPYRYDDYDGGESMAEHEIIAQEQDNQHIRRLRREYIAAGWLDAEWLPYFYDDEQAAMIVWDILEELGFYPAVPLLNRPSFIVGEDKCDRYGFYLYGIDLVWVERWEWDNQMQAFCSQLGECFYFENSSEPLNRTVKTCKQL